MKSGKDWGEWGEGFGKSMEAKFANPHAFRRREKLSLGWLLSGLLILAWGVTWLGNDLGWWEFNFPFWPALIILVAFGVLLSQFKKFF